jgi:SAM-dependent methyltransferase
VRPLNQMVMEEAEAATNVNVDKPTPKVPASAWKWPPVWPFRSDDFDAMPGVDNGVLEGGYSSNQKSKLTEHISKFLGDGEKVLELCSSTSQGVVDTSDRVVFEDGDVGGANPLAPLLQFHNPKFPVESNSFDAVVLTDGVECLTNPRDVFREVWRVLKPGGKCLVCFASKPSALPNRFSPVKTWTTMTTEQKIWIVGSYFHYSAGPGWKGIEGYDAGGSAGEGELVFSEATESDVAFVVQAEKLARRNNNPTPFEDISYSLLTAKNMEAEDREYSALRLSAQVKDAASDAERAVLIKSAEMLPDIYAILAAVQDQVVPKPAKAQLANYLLPTWKNSDEQVQALRKGLGLDAADDFWGAIGTSTTNLPPREKIVFLAEAISQVGVNDKLVGLPAAMASIVGALKQRIPDEEELQNIEKFTAKVVVSDYLMSGGPNAAERIMRYIGSLSDSALKDMVCPPTEKK